jgi:hypothetical protein
MQSPLGSLSPWQKFINEARLSYPNIQFLDVQIDNPELGGDAALLRSLLGQTGTTGYPSINLYIEDRSIPYNGPRIPSQMMDFLGQY